MAYMTVSVEANDLPMLKVAKDMANVLKRIYLADKTNNDGSIMGEALLSPYFSRAIEDIFKEGCMDLEMNNGF